MIAKCLKLQHNEDVAQRLPDDEWALPHEPHPQRAEYPYSTNVPNLMLWTGRGHVIVLELKSG